MKGFTRRDFLYTAAAGAAGLAAGCGRPAPEPDSDAKQAQPAGPPNIVLIMLDTLRADKLGCYGCPHEVSPALDRIAGRGTVFERVVAQCSWTRPSVGSMLTSLHPRTLGLYKERDEALDSRFATLPEMLQQHGYRTFGATANPNMNEIYGFHRGFDEYIESSVVFGWMDTAESKETEVRGKVSLPGAPWLFGQALDFARKGDGPCFLQLNLMEIHEWYVRDSYTMRRPEYNGLFSDTGEAYPKYLQAVRQLTDDTGAFIESLESLPGWDNTVFAIVSDHGEGLDDHPSVAKSMYHGRVLYESNSMVPWILYNPAWKPARPRVSQAVRLLEVMPTLLDCAGVPGPAGMAGVSLLPLVNGVADRAPVPDRFVLESHFREPRLAVYDPDWKLYDNRPPHPTLPRFELQPWGIREDGFHTDAAARHAAEAEARKQFLEQWEREHPMAAPTPADMELSDEMREQLEAIGYLGGPDD